MKKLLFMLVLLPAFAFGQQKYDTTVTNTGVAKAGHAHTWLVRSYPDDNAAASVGAHVLARTSKSVSRICKVCYRHEQIDQRRDTAGMCDFDKALFEASLLQKQQQR